jgi:hypothetical protein
VLTELYHQMKAKPVQCAGTTSCYPAFDSAVGPESQGGEMGCRGFAEFFDESSEYLNGAFGGRPTTS